VALPRRARSNGLTAVTPLLPPSGGSCPNCRACSSCSTILPRAIVLPTLPVPAPLRCAPCGREHDGSSACDSGASAVQSSVDALRASRAWGEYQGWGTEPGASRGGGASPSSSWTTEVCRAARTGALPAPALVRLLPLFTVRCSACLASGRPGILRSPNPNPAPQAVALRPGTQPVLTWKGTKWYRKDCAVEGVVPLGEVLQAGGRRPGAPLSLRFANPSPSPASLTLCDAPIDLLGEVQGGGAPVLPLSWPGSATRFVSLVGADTYGLLEEGGEGHAVTVHAEAGPGARALLHYTVTVGHATYSMSLLLRLPG
jgi:hypothetical protein